MNKLNLEIPQWIIKRRVKFSDVEGGFLVQPIDDIGRNYSFLKQVTIMDYFDIELFAEPFYWKRALSDKFKVDLKLIGHYEEPNLTIELENGKYNGKIYELIYNPFLKSWQDVNIIEESNL
jgi:hypothetical protein